MNIIFRRFPPFEPKRTRQIARISAGPVKLVFSGNNLILSAALLLHPQYNNIITWRSLNKIGINPDTSGFIPTRWEEIGNRNEIKLSQFFLGRFAEGYFDYKKDLLNYLC